MGSVDYYTDNMQYMWESVSVTFLLPSYMDHCSCGNWSALKTLKISHSSSNWTSDLTDCETVRINHVINNLDRFCVCLYIYFFLIYFLTGMIPMLIIFFACISCH